MNRARQRKRLILRRLAKRRNRYESPAVATETAPDLSFLRWQPEKGQPKQEAEDKRLLEV